MGRQYDREVVAGIGLYPDSGWQSYVAGLGGGMAALSERPTLPWSFKVVDDPAVNAFAVPGGFIYVTRGILAHLNSEAELAAVVGHEIGHVTARHSAQSLSRQQLFQLGIIAGSVASRSVARYAGVASEAAGVLFLKFSRDDEREADLLGLRYMGRARYDTREMADVFTVLERQGAAAGGDRLPEWLATHPDPGDRRERILAQIAAQPDQAAGTTVNRDAYLRRLDGVIFGADPRDGFFRGDEFLHPRLRFQITFPSAWRHQNGMQAVVSMSPQQDAAVELAVSDAASADAAARAFLAQQGVSAGPATRTTLAGAPAVSAAFSAAGDNVSVRGTALFVDYGGRVFVIVGYGSAAGWAARQAAIGASLRSFRPLTDPAALAVRPNRVDVFAVPSATTIAALHRQRPSPLTPEQLALINQVEPDTPLDAGRLVKWVVENRPPWAR